jgi:hypothetical protein
MKIALSAAAVLAVAGAASAAPFVVGAVNVQGIGASAVSPSSGSFYTDPRLQEGGYTGNWWAGASSNRIPGASYGYPGSIIGGGAPVRDAMLSSTFMTIDGRNPGVPGDGNTAAMSGQLGLGTQPALNAGNWLGVSFASTGTSTQGTWSYGLTDINNGVGSASGLLDIGGVDYDAVFIARFVTDQGAGLVFGQQNVQVAVKDATDPGQFQTGSEVSWDGTPNALAALGGDILSIYITSTDFASVDDGVTRTAHDIYLVRNIPAPGAVALLGLAGLAGARRRR